MAEPVAAFAPDVVRLPPDSAARLAKLGRDAVPVQLAPGLELTLWAPEPLIADPIGLAFDARGRAFVTRTTRTDRAEIDIR